MTEIYYDLHIHSALSPCADDEMTPNNIVNMALIKGLDVIAVCDHNCADNTPAIEKAAENSGLLFIPGVEVNTAEEVHLLVLFAEVDKAVAFGDVIYDSLPDMKNEPEFFGNQLIMDADDEVTGIKEKMLLSASAFGLSQCYGMAAEYGGVAIPAHVNKEVNSLLANLGFFPEDIHIPTIEVWRGGMELDTDGFNLVYNSDAHTLGDIAERQNFLLSAVKDRDSILKKLCAKKDNL